MRIAIYGRSFRKGFEGNISALLRMISDRKLDVIMYKPFHDFLLRETSFKPLAHGFFETHEDLRGNADYMFSIGGDGTFLDSVLIIRDSGIPIIGINTGRLGFLANVLPEETESALDALMASDFVIERRSLAQLLYEGSDVETFSYALNEVSIQKQFSSMITIHTYLDECYLNSYWADGLIISTPTGSTAYSLSVGGPIISPESNTFIISPMAPHNLTIRPVVVPDTAVIKLKVDASGQQVKLTLDSRSILYPTGAEIIIKKAGFTVKTVRLKNNTFYDTLRNKLMWGVDKRN
jgi:NAD+ kinase